MSNDPDLDDGYFFKGKRYETEQERDEAAADYGDYIYEQEKDRKLTEGE